MRVPPIATPQDPGLPKLDRSGGLVAMALQEALTVVARVRAGQGIAQDAESFRAHVKKLLTAAHGELQGYGYSDESVRLAVYAFVAFLDESVLASSAPAFLGWSRQPLQEEVFGDHRAGETFFQNLDELLTRGGDAQAADVLEVYQLCLLMGFHGRYRDDPVQLERYRDAVARRVDGIRGPVGALAPDVLPPGGERVTGPRDRWLRPLVGVAGAVALLLVVAFVGYTVVLGGRVDLLRDTASRVLGVG
jgi:type VI secretion system protein ImpK